MRSFLGKRLYGLGERVLTRIPVFNKIYLWVRQISEGIRLAWNAYDTARSQLEDFKLHVNASTKALQAYRKQFTIGQRTLVDVLDQENEVFQANINYTNALNDLMFAEYRILAGTGRLLWALEVPLPEQADTLE